MDNLNDTIIKSFKDFLNESKSYSDLDDIIYNKINPIEQEDLEDIFVELEDNGARVDVSYVHDSDDDSELILSFNNQLTIEVNIDFRFYKSDEPINVYNYIKLLINTLGEQFSGLETDFLSTSNLKEMIESESVIYDNKDLTLTIKDYVTNVTDIIFYVYYDVQLSERELIKIYGFDKTDNLTDKIFWELTQEDLFNLTLSDRYLSFIENSHEFVDFNYKYMMTDVIYELNTENTKYLIEDILGNIEKISLYDKDDVESVEDIKDMINKLDSEFLYEYVYLEDVSIAFQEVIEVYESHYQDSFYSMFIDSIIDSILYEFKNEGVDYDLLESDKYEDPIIRLNVNDDVLSNQINYRCSDVEELFNNYLLDHKIYDLTPKIDINYVQIDHKGYNKEVSAIFGL